MLKLIFSGLWPIILAILFFCGSIVIHEFGHYLAAKARGLYVPRFSIGFGPALLKMRIGETEFRLALLPFGGYVSLPQLADLKEIEGKFDLPNGSKVATCADKVIVATMGPVANVLFAIILSCILWKVGLPVDSSMLSRTVGYVESSLVLDSGEVVSSPAREAGLEIGDEIVAIDGIAVKNFSDIQQLIALGSQRDASGYAKSSLRVIRGGKHIDLELKPLLISGNGSDKFRKIGILPRQELIVESERGGIKIGDQILKINGEDVLNVRFLQEKIKNRRLVTLEVLRGGKTVIEEVRTIPMAVEKPYAILRFGDIVADVIPFYADGIDRSLISESTEGKLLLFSEQRDALREYNLANGFEIVRINGRECSNLCDIARAINRHGENALSVLGSDMPYNITLPQVQVQLVPAAYTNVLGINLGTRAIILHKRPFEQIGETIATTFQTLGGLLNKNSDISVKHLMGPAGLARTLHMFSKTDIRLLLWFVVLINVNLAILNMLPLPVLDGGIVAISLVEKFTGRRCAGKFFGLLQSAFLFMLFGLLIYVSFYDFRRWMADGMAKNTYSRQARLRM